MESYKSRVDYTVSDNTKVTYSFPFQYLKKKFVKVDVTSTDNTVATLTYGVDYTVTDLSITLTAALEVGKTLTIYRETDTDSIVSWNDGSILLAADMSLSDVQMLHLQEEQQDYLKTHSIRTETTAYNETVFDANSHRIHNVADPIDAQDAVTKNYMESVQSGFVQQNTALKNETTKQASAATVSATNAKTSETNSKTSETNAATSAAAAKVSETNSKTSETNAKTSETNAATSETAAATSEANAKTSEANAKTSEANAKTSETKSKDSENAARVSEQKAAESARVATENAMDFNMLKRNKEYAIGDIAYSSYLPSWTRLECVIAGTTAVTVPSSITTVSSGGVLISDGTVLWIADDVRDMTPVGSVRGSLFLPKGYIKANGATVQRADYPRLVQFINSNNLWTDDTATNAGLFGRGDGSSTFVLPDYRERIPQYTEANIGAKRNAGLPNITGELAGILIADNGEKTFRNAFVYGGMNNPNDGNMDGTHGNGDVAGYTTTSTGKLISFKFDAHTSNSIYGSSETVQPPAVNVIPILRY